MKRWTKPNRTTALSPSSAPADLVVSKSQNGHGTNRRGTTLLIVIALLGLLTLMGFVFYSFASQELSNATNYVESAKNAVTAPDDGMNFFLRQLLVGPETVEQNSVLSSRYHSMIPNLVGSDSRPASGTGRPSATALFAAAPDSLGNVADSGLNFSRGARSGGRVVNLPQPDVGYTYPDHNNMFLGHIGFAVRRAGGVNSYVPVIMPSFMRPGTFRTTAVSGAGHGSGANIGITDNTTPTAGSNTAWYASPIYQHLSFRPNPANIYIAPNGRPVDDPTIAGTQNMLRFLDGTNSDDTPEISTLRSGGFPFSPVAPTGYIGVDPTKAGEMGIWTNPAAVGPALTAYELDVDNDGDGIPDSIWLDLDYPVLEDPATGAKYTMLFSTLVLDLDGLINLNATGNLNGFVNFRDGTLPFGGWTSTTTIPSASATPPTMPGTTAWFPVPPVGGRTNFVSQSNLSLSPYEINPLWGMLRTPPTGVFDYTQHHAHFGRQFGSGPTVRPVDASEVANMELFWLLKGRGEYTDDTGTNLDDMFVGKWGDSDRLYKALNNISDPLVLTAMPFPGSSYQDDNANVAEGAAGNSQRGFGQPLDYSGAGSFVLGNDPRRPFTKSGAGTPLSWQQYFAYTLFDSTPFDNILIWNGTWQSSDFSKFVLGPNGTWDGGGAGTDDLILTPLANRLFDDPAESIVDPDRKQRTIDEVFGAKDLATLFLQDEDLDPTGTTKRLINLMPFTLNANGGDTVDEDIRKRFTTLSWRLRNFNLQDPRGVDRLLGTADDLVRSWEFNADSSLLDSNNDGINDPNNRFEFPPRFGASVTYSEGATTININPLRPFERRVTNSNIYEDPFRPQARRMLRLELDDPNNDFGQLPLSINQLVDVERLPNRTADLLRGTLELRPLTEHPDESETDTMGNPIVLQTGALPVSSYNNLPRFPPSTVPEREFWARRDRQKLARDIYVLLYTMGGAVNGTFGSNYTNTVNNINAQVPSYTFAGAGGAPSYSPEQLRQMAQFAVNLVDALDRDNVITKFEYDMNLGTTVIDDNVVRTDGDPSTTPQYLVGWNLDDNPDTNTDLTLDPSLTADAAFDLNDYERGVVYGVEAQQLTLGEAIAVLSGEVDPNNDATPFNDRDGNRLHAFYELQNMLPYNVPLATSVSTAAGTGIWRVRTEIDASNTGAGTSNKTTTFIASGAAGSASFDVVTAGSQYTVAARDKQYASTSCSDYFINEQVTATPDYKRLIPPNAVAIVTDLTTPGRTSDHVDLFYHDNSTAIRTKASMGGADTIFEDLDFTALDVTNPPRITYILERRANPNMPSLPVADNGWVEVDRLDQPFEGLDYTGVSDNASLLTALSTMRSTVRTEALDRGTEGDHAATANAIFEYTSIGLHRGASFELRQDHFDRDFGSIVELFDLPLFGPESLTAMYVEVGNTPTGQATASTTAQAHMPGGTIVGDSGTGTQLPVAPPLWQRPLGEGLVSGASAKFLMANFPDANTTVGTGITGELPYDNTWHRVLAMLEVPSRMHRQLGNPIQLKRIPGAINLNTVRHAAVLAALIDDAQVADLSLPVIPLTPPTLPDQLHAFATAGGHPTSAGDRATTGAGGANAGDWFNQLIEARDGQFASTPVVGGGVVTLFIPGLHDNPATGALNEDSKPFRDAGPARLASAPLAPPDLGHTLMRELPAAAGSATDQRHLLEVSTAGDHTANDYNYYDVTNTTNATSPSSSRLRNRVLAKVMNNSSTQSNAFVVYVTIGFFEVYEDPATGAVRIGGQYDFDQDISTPIEDNHQKSLFVIDRSEVFQAYDAGSGQFDWRRLVKHRTDVQK